MERRGAAGVIIGNEVLSAKVVDQNGAFLIQRLREQGLELRSLSIIPDEVDQIVETVARARAQALHVFTSGGIGPTHDDVTVRSVALALGRCVVRDPALEQVVRKHYPPPLTPETLRLAEIPQGATLQSRDGLWFPVISVEGIHLLPGVPQLFRAQLDTVLANLPRGEIFVSCLYLSAPEAQIAGVLDAVAIAHPQVAIGSYPTFDRSLDYRVKVTVEHVQKSQVERVMSALLQALPSGCVVRSDTQESG